eukprot:TRINITY_DN20182_c0_g1_i1.p1 TRINITY_DN20182_c0_g1~~TRINITY_DN20182_c0_g1_i1.p1  ORF type:complete len:458 (+),score=108.77 TRINITY_DN20182_c0_g1_i1:271-1644(+)
MDFFKSVFSNDPEPSDLPNHLRSESPEPQENQYLEAEDEKDEEQDQEPPPNSNSNLNSSAWSFGGLIKTLASKSESVIETYRRDLEEFGTGLKKETAAMREAASRAVKDLPISIEVSASAAQDSIESIGQKIDGFGSSVWRGTTEIISQGKEALLAPDLDSDYSFDALNINKRYSRFETQVIGIQNDANTYAEDPEDLDDYNKWKLGFMLKEKKEEIKNLCSEDGPMEAIYVQMVPNVIDHETFWCRYFYRVYKVKQAEDARVNLVKRAISGEEEEDLSWDVDDEEEGSIDVSELKSEKDSIELGIEKKPIEESQSRSVEVVSEIGEKSSDNVGESVSDKAMDEKVIEGKSVVDHTESSADESVEKSDEKGSSEGKAEMVESSKDSDFSVVSSQPGHEEDDDLGWDEIEDLSSIDEKKMTTGSGSSPSKFDLRKRLSSADDEEDLSWDIEDEEPVKP